MFERTTISLQGKRNQSVPFEFKYFGSGMLSNPTATCGCTNLAIQGKSLTGTLSIGTRSGTFTKNVSVQVVEGNKTKKQVLNLNCKVIT